jgi:hypothetical protein
LLCRLAQTGTARVRYGPVRTALAVGRELIGKDDAALVLGL